MTETLQNLEAKILELCDKGYRYFFVGGALGFDTIAAIALAHVASQLKTRIHTVLCLPCAEQTKLWNENEKRTYELLLPFYEAHILISDNYNSECMRLRNYYMVAHSSYCIAYMTHYGGGTANTVNYAKKKGLRLFNAAVMSEIN